MNAHQVQNNPRDHLRKNNLLLTMIWLNNCSHDVKQQSLTYSILNIVQTNYLASQPINTLS